MKFKLFLFVFIFILFPCLAIAGSINIDRIWTEDDYCYVLVTYRNDTEKTFEQMVRIKCMAKDSQGGKININTRSFFTHDVGSIGPGFEDTLKIPIKVNGIKVKSVECRATGQ